MTEALQRFPYVYVLALALALPRSMKSGLWQQYWLDLCINMCAKSVPNGSGVTAIFAN